MALVNNIISAIGNNSSIYPLIVRDCGIEVPTKVYKTYKQNKDDKEVAYLATRERIIDEYATSAVWLGGIPLIGNLCNRIISKIGYNPSVNVKLINAEDEIKKLEDKLLSESEKSNILRIKEKISELKLQTIDSNIERFKDNDVAKRAVEDLKKVKSNSAIYKKLQGNKFFLEMALPILFMGVIIPKAVYALTAFTRRKNSKYRPKTVNYALNNTQQISMMSFMTQNTDKPSFGANISSTMCNFTTVQKMAITDGGYAVGRVATARKKRGALDIAFKMTGMMYLNFVAPKQIEKILSALTKTIFNLNVNLDPVILANRDFFEQVRKNSLNLPESDKLRDIISFIDNPKNADSLYVRFASKLGKIKMLDSQTRDPRTFIDAKSLADLRNNMSNFQNEIKNLKICFNKSSSGNDKRAVAKRLELQVKNYFLKARAAKTFNVLSNVALSSYLLACVLPDVQYFLREKFLGTKLEPDLL